MTSIILLSRDLIFITKVREAVSSVGRELVVVKSAQTLGDLSQRDDREGLLLVDLEKPGVELEVVATAWQQLAARSWRCLSFFSHVHEELFGRATELGLGEVMPRSRFIRVLPDILRSL